MIYRRFKDSFYRIPNAQDRQDGNISFEYNGKVGEDFSNAVTLENGNKSVLISLEEWMSGKEIQEIDYYVWRHIGAPNSEGDK